MRIVDAHEDLAYNMLTFGRDYTRAVEVTRRIEASTEIPAHNGTALLGWPEYVQGNVVTVFATLFAAPLRAKMGNYEQLLYQDFSEAHDLYRRQVDAYLQLEYDHPALFRVIQTLPHLEEVLRRWDAYEARPPVPQAREEGEPIPPEEEAEPPQGPPVGLVMLMEGAEGVREPAELEQWWRWGVRLIGPAWIGTRYAGGTREPGPLTRDGYALLEAMAEYGFALDISHMDEKAALQALEIYERPVLASHANAAQMLKRPGVEVQSNRHLTDQVIRSLLERDGVIGIVPYNRFLLHGWTPADGRQAVTLQHVVAQIDFICQMAGNARHVGIGSDFEGGFGLESTPAGIDTVASLQALAPLLAEKGYADSDIAAILGDNWLGLLRKILPEDV